MNGFLSECIYTFILTRSRLGLKILLVFNRAMAFN